MENKTIEMPLHKPDANEKLFFMVSGMVMSIPFSIFSEFISDYFLKSISSGFTAMLLGAIIIAPFLEEFAKGYPLFYRHGETERSIFSLGFYTGLGFGIVEFFFYTIGFGAPIAVRLPAVLFHATNTSIVAYGVAKKRPARYYLLAVFLHFSYNFLALLGLFSLNLATLFVLIALSLSIILRYRTKEKMMEY